MIFGQPPMEPEALATALVTGLAAEVGRQGKEADWTNILKAVLRKMGNERGYKVNPDPYWREPSQFLLDLVWWKNADDMDIMLGVESEWGGSKAAWHDFGKLLVVKAPLKLMVFEKQTGDTVKTIEERYMQKFAQHVEGEHYLLLEFDTSKKEAQPYHFCVPSNGSLDAVRFRKLPPIAWKD